MRSSTLARKTTERKQKWRSQEGGFIEDLGHKLPRGIALCAGVCLRVCVCARLCVPICVFVSRLVNVYVNMFFFILVRCHVRLSTRTYFLLQTKSVTNNIHLDQSDYWAAGQKLKISIFSGSVNASFSGARRLCQEQQSSAWKFLWKENYSVSCFRWCV